MEELDKIKKLRAAVDRVLKKYGLELQPGSFSLIPGERDRPDIISLGAKVTLDTFKTADQKEQEIFDAELAKIAQQFEDPQPAVDPKLQQRIVDAEEFLREGWGDEPDDTV